MNKLLYEWDLEAISRFRKYGWKNAYFGLYFKNERGGRKKDQHRFIKSNLKLDERGHSNTFAVISAS